MNKEDIRIIGSMALEVICIVVALSLATHIETWIGRLVIVLCAVGFIISMLSQMFSELGGFGFCTILIVACVTFGVYFAVSWIIFGVPVTVGVQ